jgi:hypothetical protein
VERLRGDRSAIVITKTAELTLAAAALASPPGGGILVRGDTAIDLR